ncbi:protein ImuB [Ruaniaceae bacterium KH17]|nr:protein ImuB [Ruaniaceae bacterium KH17]
MSARRYCVLWVPDWPIAAAIQEGLADPLAPIAVHNNRGLLAVSAQARAGGVRTGMRRRKARQICPELVLLAADPVRDARAFDVVLRAANEAIAAPAVLRPGLVMAQAPSRTPEEELAQAVTNEVARGSGVEGFVGIASGFLTAILAARAQAIVPENASARFLAPYPVTAVRQALLTKSSQQELDGVFDAFAVLGVRTLADVVALPKGHLVSRFGKVGETIHLLASGADVRARPAEERGGDIHVGRELDPPAERADTAAFVVRAIAEDLADLLSGRSCGRLLVTVRTEDGGELNRVWMIEGALAAAEITDRVRWQIDGWLSGRSGGKPTAPLRFIELEAQEVDGAAARTEQLWGRTRSAETAERAVLRLSGMYGVQVARPVVQGGRDPRSRVRVVPWNDDPAPQRRLDAPWPGGVPEPFPPTVFEEPRPVRLLDTVGNAVTVGASGSLSAAPSRIEADGASWDIEAWSGPWLVSERWWSQPHRAAWLQIVRADAPALLIAVRGGAAVVEGVYD